MWRKIWLYRFKAFLITYGYCCSGDVTHGTLILFYSYLQMNDELRIQMAYLLRNYSVDIMKRYWMYLFSEVSNDFVGRYNAIVWNSLYFIPVFLFYFFSRLFFYKHANQWKTSEIHIQMKRKRHKFLFPGDIGKMITTFVVGFWKMFNRNCLYQEINVVKVLRR